jgi:hypothetical protein
MAEHKTKSPYVGQGTSQGGDQQQRVGGRGYAGSSRRDARRGKGGTGEQRRSKGTRGGSA